jgi:hypothetical protein
MNGEFSETVNRHNRIIKSNIKSKFPEAAALASEQLAELYENAGYHWEAVVAYKNSMVLYKIAEWRYDTIRVAKHFNRMLSKELRKTRIRD